MFTILKGVLLIACLAAFAWAGYMVPLGERTLFEHLRAVVETPETQGLMRGAKEKAGEVKERLMGQGADKQPPPETLPRKEARKEEGSPQDQIGETDQERLQQLIEALKTPR
jgi:hypothetical protein